MDSTQSIIAKTGLFEINMTKKLAKINFIFINY